MSSEYELFNFPVRNFFTSFQRRRHGTTYNARREHTYKQTIFQIYTFLLHFLLTSYPHRPWCHFQIASCICLSSPGYTHITLHIFH